MKIVDKVQFWLGLLDIVVGIGTSIIVIVTHRYSKLVLTMFPVGVGIMALFRAIETK